MSIGTRIAKLEAASPPGDCPACQQRYEYTFSNEAEPLPATPVCDVCGQPVNTVHIREIVVPAAEDEEPCRRPR